jgi:hypothetical protein
MDEVTIDLLLSPVTPSFFMEDFEVAALNGDAYKPTAGFHVADMFVI